MQKRTGDAGQGTENSFASLSKTLEDLEARLTRLSSSPSRRAAEPAAAGPVRAAVPTADVALPTQAEFTLETPAPTPSDRLRAMTQARRSRSALSTEASPLAMERQRLAAALQEPAKAAEPARRVRTSAQAAEEMRLQNETLALVRDLAGEVGQLRSEVGSQPAALDSRFEELRTSFVELKRMIGAREGADRIGAEIYEIMEALTELTAGTADQGSLDALRAEVDQISGLVGQMAREESLEAVQRRWDEFESRIGDRIELDNQAKRDLRVELERLRGSLRSLATEEQILAVQQRWDEFESRYLETARVQTEETLTRFLRDELGTLRDKLDDVVAQTGEAAIAARIEAASERTREALEASVERLSDRMGEIELTLASLPELLQVDRMEARIQALAEGVEALTREVRDPDLDRFAIVEERLDDISAALLVATTTERRVEIDMAPVERIEARVAELTARVDSFVEAGHADILSTQIAVLTERIEGMGARPASDEEIVRRIDRLSERVETLFRSVAPPIDTALWEERLATMAARLEETAAGHGMDAEAVRALEVQIQRLAELLGDSALLSGSDGEMSRRLDAVEQQLGESREAVLIAARTAAEEAVRRMQEEGLRRETAYVQELAQDLRNLEALSRDSDERTFGVFDAVHSTLTKIAERLTSIEAEMRAEGAPPVLREATRAEADDARRIEWAAARVAVGTGVAEASEPKGLRAAINRRLARRTPPAVRPAEVEPRVEPEVVSAAAPAPVETAETLPPPAELDAPALDTTDMVMREANRPLEPGSGTPDIAALLERVRLQQRGLEPASPEPAAKADFIAAARKAAMAAAAEAEALRERDRQEPSDGKAASRRSRKPILMAVGAVLMALMAIPLGQRYLENNAAAVAEAVDEAPVLASSDANELGAAGGPADSLTVASVPPHEEVPAAPSEAPPEAVAEAEAPVAETVPQAEAVAQAVPEASPVEDAAAAADVSEPAAVADVAAAPPAPMADADLLTLAAQRLPATAQGALPALPAGVDAPKLVEAVQRNEPMALFEVGLRLMEGRNGPANPAGAIDWFGQSAARGFAPAQYSLGTLFEKGNGATRDTVAASQWYRLAADQGNVRAMHNLAVLYATGIDGRSDPAAAAQWFEKAAAHGMRDSQYNLGILYARGSGVDQDLAQSYRWFSIVGAAGDKDAQDKKVEVAKSLSPEQKSQIDAEVAAWKPLPRSEEANTVRVPADWSVSEGRTASVDMTRAIRNVQAILGKLGYDAGTPDGVVGARTEAAIRQFQSKSGLEATGRIDEPLIRALLERKDA
ncbi:peptidoglycan-binding protein [Aureimonas jatrophae]|uniref:peptidoglycan-binding protein n=1 Tax=Aureimonas jatrophae TaxID=1166073 RepID=UPI0011139F04|nr:peptidoglycan-binding protein [Aureimonas jatrophae]MBB3949213.1 localization factor PodJL [Aureimonas jatrophae]